MECPVSSAGYIILNGVRCSSMYMHMYGNMTMHVAFPLIHVHVINATYIMYVVTYQHASTYVSHDRDDIT